MANIIHINKNDNKRMVQMYHKGVPYFKDNSNTGIVEMYSRGGKVRGKEEKPYELYDALVGDGKAWIDTGIYYKGTQSMCTIITVPETSPRNEEIILSSRDENSRICHISLAANNTYLSVNYGGGAYEDSNLHKNKRTIITFRDYKAYINDVLFRDWCADNRKYGTSVVPVFLFIGHDMKYTKTGISYYFHYLGIENTIALYPCKLTADIPADKSSDNKPHSAGECGMWDMVSDRFFGNANTEGEFTVE